MQQLSSVNEDNVSGRIHKKGKEKAPAVHRHREIKKKHESKEAKGKDGKGRFKKLAVSQQKRSCC